jgi:hypothetical protein
MTQMDTIQPAPPEGFSEHHDGRLFSYWCSLSHFLFLFISQQMIFLWHESHLLFSLHFCLEAGPRSDEEKYEEKYLRSRLGVSCSFWRLHVRKCSEPLHENRLTFCTALCHLPQWPSHSKIRACFHSRSWRIVTVM